MKISLSVFTRHTSIYYKCMRKKTQFRERAACRERVNECYYFINYNVNIAAYVNSIKAPAPGALEVIFFVQSWIL